MNPSRSPAFSSIPQKLSSAFQLTSRAQQQRALEKSSSKINRIIYLIFINTFSSNETLSA